MCKAGKDYDYMQRADIERRRWGNKDILRLTGWVFLFFFCFTFVSLVTLGQSGPKERGRGGAKDPLPKRAVAAGRRGVGGPGDKSPRGCTPAHLLSTWGPLCHGLFGSCRSPTFVSFSRIIITDDAEYMCLHAESRTGISRFSLMSRSRGKTEGGGRWGRQSG